MTTDNPESVTPAEAGEAHGERPGPGQRLRAAREAHRLSLEQVGESLHLDEAIVAAIEQERFDALGAPVYVRGHLKAYATLLGLPPDEILGEYRGASAPPSPALPATRTTTFTVNPTLWGAGALAILLGLMLGVYLMLGDDDVTADVAAGQHPATMPDSSDSPAGEPAPVAPEVTPEAAPKLALESPAASAPAPAAAPAPRPAATMRLGLRFNEESWVEISDANRRLLFGLQREGRNRQLTGEPPFNLLIGNAEGVELTVNDQPFAVPADGLRGKVARFEIPGDAAEQAKTP